LADHALPLAEWGAARGLVAFTYTAYLKTSFTTLRSAVSSRDVVSPDGIREIKFRAG
jgi:hypothetical protein